MFSRIVLAFMVLETIGHVLALPPINKCLFSDSACIKESALALIPLLAEGKVSPNLKTLDPLHIKQIDASVPNLKIIANDLVVKGLKDCIFESISRPSKSKIDVDIKCDVAVEGEYEINGKVLTLPLDGKGHLAITIKNLLIKVNADMGEIVKDGSKHWDIKTWKYTQVIREKANIELQNLFNGNKELSKAFRDVLGASSAELVNDLGPPIIKAIITEVVETVNEFFHTVPAQDLEIV